MSVDIQELKRKAEAELAIEAMSGVGGLIHLRPSDVLSLIAEIESLRKQLEEANEARAFNARTCVQLQDEIFQLKRQNNG